MSVICIREATRMGASRWVQVDPPKSRLFIQSDRLLGLLQVTFDVEGLKLYLIGQPGGVAGVAQRG